MPEPQTDVAVVANKGLLNLCSQEGVKKRFEQLLGGRNGAAFISSIISCANENAALSRCRPESIVAAGVMAATVNLPVTPGLGWAAIVPYKGEAQFQIMKDGYVQLALRTGQYRSINCSDVYDDEFESWNPHTGTLKTTPQESWRHREAGDIDKIVGYLAYFELLNGFKKYSYWTISQLEAHGKKYSQSYRAGKGLWVENKPAMYLKTPLKLLISHFGPMSTQMQYAMEFDQATRTPDGTVAYPDGRPVDTTSVPPEPLIPPPQKLEKPAKGKKDHKKEPEPVSDSRPPIPAGWVLERVQIEMTCGTCDEAISKLDKALHDPEENIFHHPDHFQPAK